MSFFICQSHLPQHHVDGLQGALQSGGLPQLLQSQVAPFGQQGPHLALMGGNNHRLASSKVMPWRNVPGAPALLEELLDHAQRDSETVGDFGTGAFLVVVGAKNSFTEIQR
jgi:hypothetical protein